MVCKTMIQAITLLTLALQLLVAVNKPNIPEPLKREAISVANIAINFANTLLHNPPNQIGAPIPISIPEKPSPETLLINLKPIKPYLISQPILKFADVPIGENTYITYLEFSTNIPIFCNGEFTKNCIVKESIASMLGYCRDSQKFITSIFLLEKTQYRCSISLTQERTKEFSAEEFAENDVWAEFSFITP